MVRGAIWNKGGRRGRRRRRRRSMDGRWKKARWRWRTPAVMVAVSMWAWVGVLGETRARLVDNGYEGVVVGVSQAVEDEHGAELVEALKHTLTEASRRLFVATDRRAYFRTVTIVVPREWTKVNLTHHEGSENFEDSDIKVDEMNPVYRHQPYTQQNLGCGAPGQHIHLTPTYLLNDSAARGWGSRGKVLLQEWAKYRWGVFDELGYAEDPAFPLFYISHRRNRPSLCSDREVTGRLIDKLHLSACRMLPSGEPDANCRFIPYPHQTATSSLLSDLAIRSKEVKHFCGTEGRPHNSAAPTKHNFHCRGRSAWDVILSHSDFEDGANPPSDHFENPTFRVVQQADATYALVLDYSGSMNNHYRVHKLRRIARRWLLYEVATGSYVSIINFNKNARLVRSLTRVTDKASRKLLANSIETKADGGTSIGSGLYVAARQVLRDSANPVILLITDGEENENPRIDHVLFDVVKSGARVVTVAFGEEADLQLEKVARSTGGKTFTVIDIDEGQMLEDAFVGALTFQPPQPDTPITIFETVYKDGGREASSTFHVDFTVGRNLTLRLETGAQVSSSSPRLTNPQITSAPVLIGPDGTVYRNARFDPDSSTWLLVVPLAEAGLWQWKVGLSGERSTSVRVRIVSLQRDPSVQPITTKAWISHGAKDVNATVDRVVIFAKVMQGNSPVVNADVRAFITPPHEHEPTQVYTLRDNGQGADITAGDGVYSHYMTHFTSPGRYIVRAQVTDGGTAVIHSGTSQPVRRRRREVEEKGEEEEEEQDMDEDYIHTILGVPERCCGSVIPVPRDSTPTGNFQRTYSGGSLKVTNVPETDVLAPSRVRDLSVALVGVGWGRGSLPIHASVRIRWTAPGDDLDSGIVSGYELRMSTDVRNLEEENFIVNSSSSSSSSSSSYNNNNSMTGWSVVDLSGLPVEVEGGTHLLLNVSLTLNSHKTYFALRAWDDVGSVSEVSNLAPLYLDPARVRTSTGGMGAWVVVVVVVVVLCLLVVVAMLCLARRRTRTAAQKLI